MDGQSDEEYQAGLDTMLTMQKEGKFQALGLSNVSEAQLDVAQKITKVATISNAYSLLNRADDALIDRCERDGIAYLPFFPLAVGTMHKQAALQKWAEELSATPSQIALAWLLKRSPAMLPIPGTSSSVHLRENVAAGDIDFPAEAFDDIALVFSTLSDKA
jgi:pyridoxine 4-dehydrogenase